MQVLIYAKFISNLKITANLSTNQNTINSPCSLLLAPATGVDAASLCPHEVLCQVQSIVNRCGGGAEGGALESISIQNSSSIRLGVDNGVRTKHRPVHPDTGLSS